MSQSRGLRETIEDRFNSGTDQDLTSAGWTKLAGSAVIKENGSSLAYSTSTGNNYAYYTIDNSYSHENRWISCYVASKVANVSAGVVIGASVSGGRITTAHVSVTRGAATDSFTYVTITSGGSPVAVALGTLSTPGSDRLIVLHRVGDNLHIDIGSGAIVSDQTCGSTFAQLGVNPGLYFQGILLSVGNQAEWHDFEVRDHPYKSSGINLGYRHFA